jgi:hypothetical protein
MKGMVRAIRMIAATRRAQDFSKKPGNIKK